MSKFDMRYDIAALCAADCTTPPNILPSDTHPWMNGDRFTNNNGETWKYSYRSREWRKVSR